MAIVTRVVLDVLKPHQPDALIFAGELADLGTNYKISLVVQEMDDKTQSILLCIKGDRIDFDEIRRHVTALGGSVHSIDEVDVRSEPAVD